MPRSVVDLLAGGKGILEYIRMLPCGGWFLIVLCGVFGGKGMLGTLRIVNSYVFKLCMSGF